MQLRIRDFIETKEGLYFAVVSYYHPKDKYLAFLRYYPDERGDRIKKGITFKKVSSTQDSYQYLRKNFPFYIHEDMQAVPKDKIKKIYLPFQGLERIYNSPKIKLEEKAIKVSEIFKEIPLNKKGVTGSLLIEISNEYSDIDFVIYGRKNYEKAREILKESRELMLTKKEWYKVYKKRFPTEKTLSFEEFLWYEKRKHHKGKIEGTIFDVLFVRDFDEIPKKESKFKRIKKIKLRAEVIDASFACDSPAIYKIKSDIASEVVSYTHTYALQAFEGEIIEVCGYLEKAIEKDYYRIVVGTTREAEGEYIRVVNAPTGI